MIHSLYHALAWTWGGDGGGGANGTGYLISSGPFPDLALLVFFAHLWHHTCHEKTFCFRPGKMPVPGSALHVCRRHAELRGLKHPEGK
jgi:hypothetical protein